MILLRGKSRIHSDSCDYIDDDDLQILFVRQVGNLWGVWWHSKTQG